MATILLVDDVHDILDLMTQKLQNHGYTVVTASNGAEAVTAVAQSAPSLILMDINMPELDGIEATWQIRAAEPDKQIPVIAITAYALPGIKSERLRQAAMPSILNQSTSMNSSTK